VIKVLIVDDSAVVRQILSQELSKYKDIDIIGTAPDPYVARDKIVYLNPDVITLDIEMPRMDGLTFLRKLMQYHPVPTIVVSSLTPKGSEMAIEALDTGAIDVICKPGVAYTVGDILPILYNQICAAKRVDFSKLKKIQSVSRTISSKKLSLSKTTNKVIAIGASTGGTVAIESILKQMPINTPGIVIVQHMPEKFTTSFAKRLNDLCEIEVREAKNGDSILPGLALIAPGNFHMVVDRSGAYYYVKVKSGLPVFHQRPSVEVMFNSIAKYVGKNAIGIILTGMGSDGAQGLLEIKEAGGVTIAQDKHTSVVYGMPGEAAKLNAAEYILPLNSIAEKAVKLSEE
jgi:two-component system chemotaxis response regulator CheB